MERYYFYCPSKYRIGQRKVNVLNFKIEALYEENITDKNGRKIQHFSYFDVIKVDVATKVKGYFDFDVDTGTDSCTGHWAKSKREFLKDQEERGYKMISERQYNRLRKLALLLMFRYSETFNQLQKGTNLYAWANESYHAFYDIRLIALNYQYNSKNHDQKFLQYLKERELPLNDVTISEEIRIHIARPKPGQRPYQSYRFSIKGNDQYLRYQNFDEALGRLHSKSENYEEITDLQFARIRKLCKYLMYEFSPLDQSRIIPEQSYSVRIII